MKKYKKIFNDLQDIDLEMAIEEEKGNLINYETMFEAIIQPSAYVKNLLNLLDENKNLLKNNTHPEDLVTNITNLYKNHKVIFKVNTFPIDNNIMVHHGGNDGNYIYIFCTPLILNAFKNYKEFKNQFAKFLKHEIIHREQNVRINNDEEIKKIIKKSRKGQIAYYSSKQEIMAYAWQIVNDFRIRGKSDKIIKDLIGKDSILATKFSPPLKMYKDLFLQNSNILKLLYKYIYLYLDV